uniref:Uncharacterized protein n=1 Tax=Macaca mulatta TaxID=9544 RepID=A0A5F7ZZ09_MACMU
MVTHCSAAWATEPDHIKKKKNGEPSPTLCPSARPSPLLVTELLHSWEIGDKFLKRPKPVIHGSHLEQLHFLQNSDLLETEDRLLTGPGWKMLRGLLDLLKHTPVDHPDCLPVQDALRISQDLFPASGQTLTPLDCSHNGLPRWRPPFLRHTCILIEYGEYLCLFRPANIGLFISREETWVECWYVLTLQHKQLQQVW